MAHLVDIFLQPSKVFAELKAKPTFLVPLLLVMLFSAALTLLYFIKVDPSWYLDHAVQASGSDMSASEIATTKKMMPGSRTMGMIGAPSAAIGTAIGAAIYALYLMLAGKVLGQDISFRRGLSLACWSNMPTLLGLLAALATVFTMSPQTPLESVMLTNLDPLIVQLPLDSAWSTLAKSFNLLIFWVWFLLALGWRTWGKTSWTQAVAVAVLPSLVVYGAMAAYAAFK